MEMNSVTSSQGSEQHEHTDVWLQPGKQRVVGSGIKEMEVIRTRTRGDGKGVKLRVWHEDGTEIRVMELSPDTGQTSTVADNGSGKSLEP